MGSDDEYILGESGPGFGGFWVRYIPFIVAIAVAFGLVGAFVGHGFMSPPQPVRYGIPLAADACTTDFTQRDGWQYNRMFVLIENETTKENATYSLPSSACLDMQTHLKNRIVFRLDDDRHNPEYIEWYRFL